MTPDEMQAHLQSAFAAQAATAREAALRESGVVALSLLLGVHNIGITPE